MVRIEACKVGMKVIGNESASTMYGVTKEGYVGKITKVYNRYIELDDKYIVDSAYFNLLETKDFAEVVITEKILRDILRCPEGCGVEIEDDEYSPYTINKEEVVDNEGDSQTLDNFLGNILYNENSYRIIDLKNDYVEMTMEEVCEALGKNVKIIKEKNND